MSCASIGTLFKDDILYVSSDIYFKDDVLYFSCDTYLKTTSCMSVSTMPTLWRKTSMTFCLSLFGWSASPLVPYMEKLRWICKRERTFCIWLDQNIIHLTTATSLPSSVERETYLIVKCLLREKRDMCSMSWKSFPRVETSVACCSRVYLKMREV